MLLPNLTEGAEVSRRIDTASHNAAGKYKHKLNQAFPVLRSTRYRNRMARNLHALQCAMPSARLLDCLTGTQPWRHVRYAVRWYVVRWYRRNADWHASAGAVQPVSCSLYSDGVENKTERAMYRLEIIERISAKVFPPTCSAFRAICLAFAMAPLPVNAGMLGSECLPSGAINKLKALTSPTAFWTAALKDIDAEVQGAYTASRLLRVDIARSRTEQALDERELRASGIQPVVDPKMEAAVNDTYRDLIRTDADLLQHKLLWADRCRAYARSKLQE